MYILIVESAEVKSSDGTVMTKSGQKMLVMNEREGYVEATSYNWSGSGNFFRGSKIFSTREEAEAFAKRWTGHPWYCRPNGNYEVIPVEETYRQAQVFDGYAPVSAEVE